MAGIAGFKYKMFSSPIDLAAFVVASVTTVYSIIHTTDGQYVVFYA